MVKTSASGAEDPGFESCLQRDFFRVKSYQWLKKVGTPVTSLPGAWHYRVSAGTGQPGVSILWLGEIESLICSFSVWSAASISVWQHVKLSVQIRPWDTLACCWDVNQPTNILYKGRRCGTVSVIAVLVLFYTVSWMQFLRNQGYMCKLFVHKEMWHPAPSIPLW